MREILFRGKRLRDGTWVYGNLFVDEKKDKHEILCGYTNYRIAWEVDPKTVGQFTGLTANGKKIFDGDIIKICFEEDGEPPSTAHVWCEIGKVIWHEQLHGWYVLFDNPDGVQMQEYADYLDDVEVIGNIHDNPELLEDDK